MGDRRSSWLRRLLVLPIAIVLMQGHALGAESDTLRKDREDIERIALDRSAALVSGDVAKLDKILAPTFVYTNSSGERSTKQAYLARMNNPSVKWISQDMTDIDVQVYGDAAVLTAIVHDRVTFEGTLLDTKFRSTFVYVREGGAWRCVAGHTGPLSSEH